ncbi:MAG: zf-HC2 domain-containing protein [Roseiflexaceae bacterium]|nr:zf-HC2 domain-containing protein [Roseiflexaceae bacterium]
MKHDPRHIRRYLDGELAPDQANIFRAHLAECATCRQQLAALELLDARLHELDRAAPSFSIAAQVRAQISHLPPPRRAAHGQLATALAMALAGALAIAATFEAFLQSAVDLYALLGQVQTWSLGLLSGNRLGSLDFSYTAGAPLTLVVGLALICTASLLLLRQSLAEPLEF